MAEPWTYHFTRTDLAVFFVRGTSPRSGYRLETVNRTLPDMAAPVDGLVPPFESTTTLFGSTFHSVAILDGGLWGQLQPYFPVGRDGDYVIGFQALRNLCYLRGVPQPRRLKGEPSVEDREGLKWRARHQLAYHRAVLDQQLTLVQETPLESIYRECRKLWQDEYCDLCR